jgi:hypothetical protein
MFGKLYNQKQILPHLLFFALLIIILWPLKEASLGHLIKLVFVHASLIQISLALLLINSFISAAAFFWQKEKLTILVKILLHFSVWSWAIAYLGSVWVTKAAWGAIDWDEPRFLASTQLLFLLLPYWGLNLIINYDWLLKFTSIGMGLFAQFLIRLAPVRLHPENPVGQSESWLIQTGFFSLLFLLSIWFFYTIYSIYRRKLLRYGEK